MGARSERSPAPGDVGRTKSGGSGGERSVLTPMCALYPVELNPQISHNAEGEAEHRGDTRQEKGEREQGKPNARCAPTRCLAPGASLWSVDTKHWVCSNSPQGRAGSTAACSRARSSHIAARGGGWVTARDSE